MAKKSEPIWDVLNLPLDPSRRDPVLRCGDYYVAIDGEKVMCVLGYAHDGRHLDRNGNPFTADPLTP